MFKTPKRMSKKGSTEELIPFFILGYSFTNSSSAKRPFPSRSAEDERCKEEPDAKRLQQQEYPRDPWHDDDDDDD